MADVKLTGQHWIAGSLAPPREESFRATCAETGAFLEPGYGEATPEQISAACEAASSAFHEYRNVAAEGRARLLETIADEVLAAGDALLDRCHLETALGRDRLMFERQRTVNQARLFAQVVREGHWTEPRLDHADATRQAPDCRSMWLPIGPVAVFGASNFPLAISVVGNDTIAALAAGCSVVVKAHPGHPGTCEILAGCLNRAIRRCALPAGLFSLLHGVSHEVGQSLVQNPRIQAVGFTGSLTGGRALYDAVGRRAQLIPIYAEMGSVNPVFFFPQALRNDRWQPLVAKLVGSITAGCGQMCTQPGLLLGLKQTEWQELRREVQAKVTDQTFTLLHPGIAKAFRQLTAERGAQAISITSMAAAQKTSESDCCVPGVIFEATATELLEHTHWEEEIFGPSTVFVECEEVQQMLAYAQQMKGSLTASIFATDDEIELVRPLLDVLQTKVGRIIFNGFPTGVQVNHAMMHGGPYPAAIGNMTSIGTGSIKRFARPVCFQGFPERLLPETLRDNLSAPTLRMIDGQYQLGSAVI
ncbi:MAG: aldehyde dehydrogenase (NADP(+)) [Planctomycetaceae bacterium]|nr:aldehyde dehydrogenase (NADP(+)) [Planctomycetaceae bacterium]